MSLKEYNYYIMRALLTSVFLVVCLSSTSCQDEFEDSKILDFDSFQVEVPSNWEKLTLAGYDSQVGGLTNGKDTLYYDYGWYSYHFDKETTETHVRTETLIDGKEALIVRPKKKGRGVTGMSVEVDSLNKLSIYGRIKREKTVLRIFDLVRFE